MIDESVLQQRLRDAFDHMVPRLGSLTNSSPVTGAQPGDASVHHKHPRPRRRSPFAIAIVTVAAVVIALTLHSHRVGQPELSAPGGAVVFTAPSLGAQTIPAAGPVNDADPLRPSWAQLAYALPPRFSTLALLSSSNTEKAFVAIDKTAGQSIEITLIDHHDASATSPAPPGTGAVSIIPRGLTISLDGGRQVTATCDIGVHATSGAIVTDYCSMPSTNPTTIDTLRTVAEYIASGFSAYFASVSAATPAEPAAFDEPDSLTAIMQPSLPGQTRRRAGVAGNELSFDWVPATIDPSSSSDTIPRTSIRIITGAYPPSLTNDVSVGLYDDSAAFWLVGPTGVAVHVATTDTSGATIERLKQMASQLASSPLLATANTTVPEVSPLATSASPATGGSPITDPTATTAATNVPVIVVDASGITGRGQAVADWLRATAHVEVTVVPASRTVEQSMLQPIGNNSTNADQLRSIVGIDGYDTFDVSLLASPLPSSTNVILVVGTDGGPPAYRATGTPSNSSG